MEQQFDYDEVFMGVSKDKTPGFHEKIFRQKPELRRVVDTVRVTDGKILDIGCGGGLMTECLPFYYPRAKVYGCDISKTAIKYARKYGTGKVRYDVFNKKFPYPSGFFDACVCLDVLEHVPDPDYMLREAKRVLKKGGVFFLAIPCEGQPFSISWFLQKIGIGHRLTFKHVGHIHPEFTHKYIERLFERHGYRIVSKRFSERIPVQILRYTQFMLPKELLELIVGSKKAEKYYDRNVVVDESGRGPDILMTVRKLWFSICRATGFIDYIDAEYFLSWSFAAWKIFLLVRK